LIFLNSKLYSKEDYRKEMGLCSEAGTPCKEAMKRKLLEVRQN